MSGLWGGKDPLLRWLRALSVVAFLALVCLVVVDPARADVPLVALLAGAVLLQLGYEVTIPGLARRTEARDRKDENE